MWNTRLLSALFSVERKWIFRRSFWSFSLFSVLFSPGVFVFVHYLCVCWRRANIVEKRASEQFVYGSNFFFFFFLLLFNFCIVSCGTSFNVNFFCSLILHSFYCALHIALFQRLFDFHFSEIVFDLHLAFLSFTRLFRLLPAFE